MAEQWCPVKGGGYISEVSFHRDFTVILHSNRDIHTLYCIVCVIIKCSYRTG